MSKRKGTPCVVLEKLKTKGKRKRSTSSVMDYSDDEKSKFLNGSMTLENDSSSGVPSGVLTPRSTPSPFPSESSTSTSDEPKTKKRRSKKPVKEETDDVEYEIEKIEGYHIDEHKDIHYLVKWKGYPEEQNTWEQVENMVHCNYLIMRYFEGNSRTKQKDIDSVTKEIEDSLEDYEIYQKLQDSDYDKRYLDEFSENFLDISPLFNGTSFDAFVEETTKQFNYIVRAIFSMYNHRDFRMFKRGQNYCICLRLCQMRREQLKQLREVQRQINKLESCLITVENKVDLAHFPKDLEYITETKPGTGVTIPTDPPVGCECTNGCSIKSKCCGKLSGLTEFAYNAFGKLRLSDHSAIYECNSKCTCDKDCPNRVVQHGRKIKLGIYKTEKVGWGVKALEKIPKGTFVCEYVGELIKDEEAVVRDIDYTERKISYLFDLDYNEEVDESLLHCIDATNCGNVARFINHSCDPNLSVFPIWIDCLDPNLPRLAFFSKKPIAKGEDINFDYENIADLEESTQDDDSRRRVRAISKIRCCCGSSNCRQWVFGNK